jgi:hypothetical protein
VAISHALPEDGCSSAKVLMSETDVGPGSYKRGRFSSKADDPTVSRLTAFPRLPSDDLQQSRELF